MPKLTTVPTLGRRRLTGGTGPPAMSSVSCTCPRSSSEAWTGRSTLPIAIAVGDGDLHGVVAGIDARAARERQRGGSAGHGGRQPDVGHLAVHGFLPFLSTT